MPDDMTNDAPSLRAKDAPDLGRFDWADPLRLSDQLSEDERLIADSAKSFAQEKLMPRVMQAFEEETSDPGIFRENGRDGPFGHDNSRRIWRAGGSYVSYGSSHGKSNGSTAVIAP